MSVEILHHLLEVHAKDLREGKPLTIEGLSGHTLIVAQRINALIRAWVVERRILKQDSNTFDSIMNTIPDGIFWKDLEGTFLGCNTVFAKLVGLNSPADIIGKTDYDIVEPSKAAEYLQADQAVLESKKPLGDILHVFPGPRWTMTHKTPMMTPDGDLFGLLGLTEDVTERMVSETRLRLSESKFRLLAETISDVIWMLDASLKLIYVNPASEAHMGYSEEEFYVMDIRDIVPDLDKDRWSQKLSSVIETLGGETQFRRSDGSLFWGSARYRVLRDAQGIFQGVIGISSDLTQIKLREQELMRQASTDPMTGAFNRRFFTSQLLKYVHLGQPFSLLFLDIDHFKRINDTYGHSVGDEAIIALSHTCQDTIREGDILGRMGGEEFAIILPDISPEQAYLLAEKIRRVIEELVINTEIHMTISIGVSSFKEEDTPESLMIRADQALYSSKHEGRNRVTAF